MAPVNNDMVIGMLMTIAAVLTINFTCLLIEILWNMPNKRRPIKPHTPSRLPLRIALGNKSRVGKDTAANHILANYASPNAIRASFAAPLYEIVNAIQSALSRDSVKDGPLMQKLATLLQEHYGPDVFAAELIERSVLPHPTRDIIVTDLRFRDTEWPLLKQHGFTTIRINRPGRPIDRDPNHRSEVDLDNVTLDYTIQNDGSLSQFLDRVGALMQHITNLEDSSDESTPSSEGNSSEGESSSEDSPSSDDGSQPKSAPTSAEEGCDLPDLVPVVDYRARFTISAAEYDPITLSW